MNVKDNCLIFTWIWNVLRCWISCQRTTHFHSLKIILIIGMLIQIITLKYNLNYKSNSNTVKSLAKCGKRISHNINPRPLHLACLTSLTCPDDLLMTFMFSPTIPKTPPPLSFVTPQLAHSFAFSLVASDWLQLITHINSCHFSLSCMYTESLLASLCYFRDWAMQFLCINPLGHVHCACVLTCDKILYFLCEFAEVDTSLGSLW